MAIYKQVAEQNAVIHTPTGRVIYLDQPPTIHTDAYLAWVAEGNSADPADPPVLMPAPPPQDVRQEILNVSQQALASGFLHIMMFDLMQRYLAQAQAIVPTVTEADLLDVNGPYYSKPYADTRVYYLQLLALQDQK